MNNNCLSMDIQLDTLIRLANCFPDNFGHCVETYGCFNQKALETELSEQGFNMKRTDYGFSFRKQGLELDQVEHNIKYRDFLFLPRAKQTVTVNLRSKEKTLPVGIRTSCSQLLCWDENSFIVPKIQRDIFTAAFGADWSKYFIFVLVISEQIRQDTVIKILENGDIVEDTPIIHRTIRRTIPNECLKL